MELIALILSIASMVGLVAASLFLRTHLPSYLAEKGKNLASKEDLANLTEIVEGIKALHLADLERVKAALLSQGQITERRRRVYEQMCLALRVFIAGHGSASEAKERFHEAYAAAWLWASDDVLSALNKFLTLQELHGLSKNPVEQTRSSEAYTEILIAMRKDAGFFDTVVQTGDYKFVQFG